MADASRCLFLDCELGAEVVVTAREEEEHDVEQLKVTEGDKDISPNSPVRRKALKRNR